MARLRNRIRKAEFFTDGELLRWPRDKRTTYSGLWALAEDSGCLEDDPFEWKLQLWPSPLDSDITVERLQQWRDELIEAGKLIPYEADGKRYLYIRTFHQHETPRNPQPADLPTPPWVHWDRTVVKRGDSEFKRNAYRVDTAAVPSRNGDGTVTVRSPQSSPVQSSPVQKGSLSESADADPAGEKEKPPDPPVRMRKKTQAEWEAERDELMEVCHFPADVLQLAELLAEENKTGQVAVSRIVRELLRPIVEMQDEFPDAALRHGLRAAITRPAPNVNYVRKAAAGYRDRPAGASAGARATAGVTDSEWHDQLQEAYSDD